MLWSEIDKNARFGPKSNYFRKKRLRIGQKSVVTFFSQTSGKRVKSAESIFVPQNEPKQVFSSSRVLDRFCLKLEKNKTMPAKSGYLRKSLRFGRNVPPPPPFPINLEEVSSAAESLSDHQNLPM